MSNENRRERLLRKYNLSVEDYNDLLEKQNFRCGICKTHISDLKRTLDVDHCHTYGTIRGLLCRACNMGLGLFKDDVKLLGRVILYLEDNAPKFLQRIEDRKMTKRGYYAENLISDSDM